MINTRFEQDLKEHEKWLSTNKKDGNQLILENKDLSCLSINNANLNESIFINCDLQRAVFNNTSLDKAKLFENKFFFAVFKNTTFNNSIIKKNIFDGCLFEGIKCSDLTLISNKFKSVIFDQTRFNNSFFTFNQYFESQFKDHTLKTTLIIEDSIKNCNHENLNYIDSFLKLLVIKNSSFIRSSIEDSFIDIREENNDYIQNKPKTFFKEYENIYNDIYDETLFKNMLERIDAFESKVFSSKQIPKDKDGLIQISGETLNELTSTYKFGYQVMLLEGKSNINKDNFTLIKNKISYLDSFIKDKLKLINAISNDPKKEINE